VMTVMIMMMYVTLLRCYGVTEACWCDIEALYGYRRWNNRVRKKTGALTFIDVEKPFCSVATKECDI
jgi:hypothetical protein